MPPEDFDAGGYQSGDHADVEAERLRVCAVRHQLHGAHEADSKQGPHRDVGHVPQRQQHEGSYLNGFVCIAKSVCVYGYVWVRTSEGVAAARCTAMKYAEYWMLTPSTLHTAPRMDKTDSTPQSRAATRSSAGLTTTFKVHTYIEVALMPQQYMCMNVCMWCVPAIHTRCGRSPYRWRSSESCGAFLNLNCSWQPRCPPAERLPPGSPRHVCMMHMIPCMTCGQAYTPLSWRWRSCISSRRPSAEPSAWPASG